MNEMSWKPPVIAVPEKDLALWNAAMSYMGAALPMAPQGAVLRLSPISAPDLQDDCLSLTLATGGVAYVHLDAFPFNALLDVAFDITDLRGLAGPLHDAICEGAVQTILDALPAELNRMMTVLAPVSMDETKAQTDTQNLVWFAAILEGVCPEPAFFSVGLAAKDLCAFLETLTISPRAALPGLKDQIEKTLFHFAGSACLTAEQAQNLEPGDLIILDQTPKEALTLQHDQDLFHFEHSEEGWRCTAMHPLWPQHRGLPMDETFPTPDASDEQITEAPVQKLAEITQTQLTFDLGEISLSLAELEQFQTGSIVPLPDTLQDPSQVEVTVRIAGVKIATGDLIQIDDRVAVRLNSVLIGT